MRFRLSLLLNSSLNRLSNAVRKFSSDFSPVGGRTIPVAPSLQREVVRRLPENLPNARLLQVAVLGEPNAGKSTLINELVGWKVCSVSRKVHTTRKNARGVLVDGETQVVFLDTPGLVTLTDSKKHSLEGSFLADPERALLETDLIVILHDVSSKFLKDSLSKKILRLLYLYPEKDAVLVMNKVDLVKEKRKLLELTNVLTSGVIGGKPLKIKTARSVTERKKPPTLEELEMKRKLRQQVNDSMKELENIKQQNLAEPEILEIIKDRSGWPGFKSVFMISALHSDGVSELRDYLISSAKPRNWLYHSSVVTDQNPHEMAKLALKEKLLEYLPNEVPYNINVGIEYWDINTSGALTVQMKVDCGKGHIAKLVIGGEGQKVKKIAREAEQELRNIFRCDVRLKLDVTPNNRE